MNLTRIAYHGRKTYRDKIMRITWEPGDSNLVTPETAKKLLRFAEFAPAEQEAEPAKKAAPAKEPKGKKADAEVAQDLQEPIDPEVEAARLREQETARAQDQERQQLEAMLLTVESMDKGALEEYARKYEVELDKRLGVVKLRAEVSTLIEQFGVR